MRERNRVFATKGRNAISRPWSPPSALTMSYVVHVHTVVSCNLLKVPLHLINLRIFLLKENCKSQPHKMMHLSFRIAFPVWIL